MRATNNQKDLLDAVQSVFNSMHHSESFERITTSAITQEVFPISLPDDEKAKVTKHINEIYKIIKNQK